MPWILKWEGETFEHDPNDSGGATKFGIDQASHPTEDIRHLTKERATEIYWASYWIPLHCDDLPAQVGEIVMNIGVNCGKSRAARWIQHAVHTLEDGVIGHWTIQAANNSLEYTAAILLKRTEEHYRDIGKGRLARYLKGWLNRNNDLYAYLGIPR